jgi:hypothetical protein
MIPEAIFNVSSSAIKVLFMDFFKSNSRYLSNYKNHSILQIGQPLRIRSLLNNYPPVIYINSK